MMRAILAHWKGSTDTVSVEWSYLGACLCSAHFVSVELLYRGAQVVVVDAPASVDQTLFG